MKAVFGLLAYWRGLRAVALAGTALIAAACGGGSDSSPPPAPQPPPPPPPAQVTKAQLIDASRFVARASFGVPYEELAGIALQGKSEWLEAQFALPIYDHEPVVRNLIARREAGDFEDFEEDMELFFIFRRLAWWNNSVVAEDIVRQRVAFALSEIFVVSDNVDTLFVYPFALSTYYDLLLNNAFGNFRDLLRDVSLHPAMGIYLSHLNNRKSDPLNNIFPDENYAREVMQLFSIGLFELNIDGSRQLDVDGFAIPTYSNDEIREFAKVFTGLSYGGEDRQVFGNDQPYFRAPMMMFDDFHEPGEKHLLNGFVIPDGQTGDQDFEDAIDNLFNHPNVGPFIGRQLIQRLVTSNPSPAYVERVARAFNGGASGERGDMKAVLRAILLDPEAEAAAGSNPAFGKLREPVERYVSLMRQFNANNGEGFIANGGFVVQELGGQHPLSAPSVFNFFSPTHSPAGEIGEAGLVAPEFEITNSTTIITFSNLLDLAVTGGFVADQGEAFDEVSLDISAFAQIADDVDELIERLDILLTYGTLSAETRDAIREVLVGISDSSFRTRTAIYLFLISPDYAVRI